MEKMKAHIGIPYIHGISEKIRRTFAKHKVNTFFIPSNKLKNGLVHPKDIIKTEDMCGVIYEVNCLNCEKVYIGKTGRALNTRIGEHKKDVSTHKQVVRTRANRNSSSKVLHKSAITDHAIGNDHIPNWNARVIEKEAQTDKRKIKESICIRKRPHNINRDIGGYDLPHTYDSLLEKVEAGGGASGDALPSIPTRRLVALFSVTYKKPDHSNPGISLKQLTDCRRNVTKV
ncbi:uncharacterized protein [Antedon mediterranea]|uniref:uncharacterized protein n=1 Tax=Antedon mediterranea TaxID=105859 RepID=UPI003AF9FFA0